MLNQLQNTLQQARARKYEKAELEARITHLLKGQYIKKAIDWSLTEEPEGKLGSSFPSMEAPWLPWKINSNSGF